ncbi:MAG: nitroreductase family protein [Spirochaetes bacterium]|nr:nitroreductase family protein [Spirochaetota bacterium]
MEYSEILRTRRSIRSYEERPVPVELLREMIRESTLAPSSGNNQPWRLVVITNGEMMRRISDESKKNLIARLEADPGDYIVRYESALRNREYNVFYNAPALVIVAGSRDYRNLLVDCALFASYFMNAAAARGLGTCWVNLGSDVRDPGLRAELGLSDDDRIVAPIIIGYPRAIPAAPIRREPDIIRIIE